MDDLILKMEAKDLDTFIDTFDKFVISKLSTRVRAFMKSLSEETISEMLDAWGIPVAEHKELYKEDGIRFDVIMERVRKADRSEIRDMTFGFECGLLVYLSQEKRFFGSKTMATVCPYGESWTYGTFLRPTFTERVDTEHEDANYLVHSSFKADNSDQVLWLRRLCVTEGL